MFPSVRDRVVAFVVANDGVEQVELPHPWQTLAEAGACPRLLAPLPGAVQAFHHLDRAERFPVDLTNAGATWTSARTHRDRTWITARSDRDVAPFTELLLTGLGTARVRA